MAENARVDSYKPKRDNHMSTTPDAMREAHFDIVNDMLQKGYTFNPPVGPALYEAMRRAHEAALTLPPAQVGGDELSAHMDGKNMIGTVRRILKEAFGEGFDKLNAAQRAHRFEWASENIAAKYSWIVRTTSFLLKRSAPTQPPTHDEREG